MSPEPPEIPPDSPPDAPPDAPPQDLASDRGQTDLHSPQRWLIELRIAHADLDNLIDIASQVPGGDQLALQRLKKRKLLLRDQIARMEREHDPREPA